MQIGNVFIIVLVCTLMLSCSGGERPQIRPEEQAAHLVAWSIDQTGELIAPSKLNEHFLENIGIPKKLRAQFIKMYEQLRADLQQVHSSHRQRRSVHYFLINRYLSDYTGSDADLDSIRFLASPLNPIYMAFALKAEDMPDWESIGNHYYIKSLGKSFGVSEGAVNEGVWMLLRNPPAVLFEAVAAMIKSNLDEVDARKPDFFFRNIMVPYLTYVSKGHPIYGPLEDSIFASYALTFGSPNEQQNQLREFAVAFKRYMAGDALNVGYINSLNSVLSEYNYRLFTHDRTCIGYEILDYHIPIRTENIGDVVFLRKVSICLSMSFLGLSTTNEKDVVITMDEVLDYVDDITYSLRNKQPLVSQERSFSAIWGDLDTGFGTVKADEISVKLLQKEFTGQSDDLITERLIRKIAVHEVKHKWDETTGADSGWYNLDCEVSAHLSDNIYGGVPLYSLLSLIYRSQRFYSSISDPQIRSILGPMIKTFWQIANDAACGKIDAQRMKTELKREYDKYSLVDGGRLPPLQLFKDSIIEPCFREMPQFINTSR